MALAYTDIGLWAALGLSGAVFVWNKKSASKSAKAAAKASQSSKASQTASVFDLQAPGRDGSRPASQLPILSAQALWDTTSSHGMVEKIRSILSLTPENWQRDVLPLLQRYSEFVQLLPASESHHHSQPGGLLQHTLDVATLALTIRQNYKLPPGVPVEDQTRLASVGSYTILIASLLHDVGKPVCDVAIDLYGRIPEKSLDRWNGLSGSMLSLQSSLGATHYTVEFEGLAQGYEAHQRLPLTLLHALVPPSGLAWLAKAPSLFSELTAYLSAEADEKSIIKEIVSKADSMSVAENLKCGSRARFASAKRAPLIERLMAALHTLAVEGAFAINRPGAPMFIDPDGEHVWIVAGKAADLCRESITNLAKQQGLSAGVPTDNTRFFDTWQEYGFCITPSKEFGKGSVWWVRVDIEEWSQVLTMLKFPMQAVFKDSPVPSVFTGTITPVDPSTPRKTAVDKQIELEQSLAADGSAEAAPAAVTFHESSAEPENVVLEQSSSVVEAVTPPESEQDIYSHTGAVVPHELAEFNTPTAEAATSNAVDAIKSDDSSASDFELTASPATLADVVDDGFLDDDDGIAVGKTFVAPTPPVQVAKAPTSARAVPNTTRRPATTPKPNADRFMAWLQNGLGTGAIIHNESSAFVHFVAGGMAIVSPKAFRNFLEQNQFVGATGASVDTLRALQREMQKSGYIAFNAPEKTFFHRYQTKSAEGETGAVITCYLIANPQAYISPVPAINDLLVKVLPPAAATP